MTAEETSADFAVLLRRFREARSLTQEELAERAALTAKAIGALERGERRRPYPHTVRSLADALELDQNDRAVLVAAVPARGVPASAASPVVTMVDSSDGMTDALPSLTPAIGPGLAPTPVTPIIGRDAELAELGALVGSGAQRLVTITGPGGVGKTRLALELLQRAAPMFPGGTRFVDLAAVREPALVLPRIAASLGLADELGTEPVTTLARHLQSLRMLLVLDNLEQLARAAPMLADLIARCPDLVIVATSRAALRVRAEHEIVLKPLATPVADDVDAVASSSAVALLIDRATAAGARIDVDEADAAVLAAITRRLDGLPLAIELAAPGLRLLSPWTLLDRLDEPGPGTGLRDLPERQRSMTAVLEWSMDLLEPEEIALFERLAVFSGGFSLDAVTAVSSTGGDAVSALAALVDQSLVQRVPSSGRQERFRLLEPVRQFAMQQLTAAGRTPTAADLHAAYFHQEAMAAAAALEGRDLVAVLDRLEPDHANLRSAFLRLLERDRDEEAAELAGSIWLYLALRGHAREGLAWLERVGPGASDAARCRILVGRLGLRLLAGDREPMHLDAEAAVTLARRVGTPALTCEVLALAGQAAVLEGARDRSAELLDRAEEQAESSGRPWVSVHVRIAQCQLALLANDLGTAAVRLPATLTAAREIGNAFTVATALNVHATLTELLGDDRATAELLGEAVALSLRARMGWTLGYALPALAALAQRVGDPESAAWLFGAYASISAADAVDPTFPVSRALSDRGLDTTRTVLGTAAFDREWDAGRTASRDEIQERAQRVTTRAAGARSA